MRRDANLLASISRRLMYVWILQCLMVIFKMVSDQFFNRDFRLPKYFENLLQPWRDPIIYRLLIHLHIYLLLIHLLQTFGGVDCLCSHRRFGSHCHYD